MSDRVLANDALSREGSMVSVAGWVHARRDMGKIIFIDLRDRSGLLQVVFPSDEEGLRKEADRLRPEWVVRVTGEVKRRTEKTVNPKIPTGTVELLAKSLDVLSVAETPPFDIHGDGREVSEDLRMTHRFLDLRRPRLKANLALRDRIIATIRNTLHREEFLEVETPILTKGTPEGAREYVVPARLQLGKFFVLPQSPQQFKQLLMVAGVERYFQIARCFRDEDTRGDRQPEFTQLDLEMSFVDVDDVLELTERLFRHVVRAVAPEKRVNDAPFPRIPYAEAMAKYRSDKPDLRKNTDDPNELAFAFIVDFPLFEFSDTERKLVPTHHLFTAPKDEDRAHLDTNPRQVKAKQYDLVLNGFEVAGGSIRIHDGALQRKIFEILRVSEEEAERRFGHMLRAFRYGVPPHGGIASGLDRFIAILANEPNIREVIAFPKTGDARDLMTGAPTELPDAQLKELHVMSTAVRHRKNQ